MKEIYKAFRIECLPNNRQKTLFRKNLGASRFAYNFALERKKSAFEKKERIPNANQLHKELVKLKGTEKLHWAYEVSKSSFEEALKDCDRAFSNFFERCKKNLKGKKGFPKLKSKKNNKQSFRLRGSISAADGYCWLPRIGRVKLAERQYIKEESKILSATVSRKADKWFVSFQVRQPIQELPESEKIIGIDLGIKNLATCSDGTIIENPKALKRNLKKLRRQHRALSRKKLGSKNREKAKLKLERTYHRIQNIRRDFLHKATTKIIHENQGIVLENLRVSNIMKNSCLAQSLHDVALSEFRRMLEYKAQWYGRKIQITDTFYPSSKICSTCGWKNDDLKLHNRTFKCQNCNQEMDRDLNAALNLKKLFTVSPTEKNASGDGSSVCNNKPSPSLKEESNAKFAQ